MLYELPIFDHPVSVSSHYGFRISPLTGKEQFHAGTDFSVNFVPSFAIKPGKVKFCGWDDEGGYWIWIVYDDGTGDRRFHLSKQLVKTGDRVKAGQKVCITGKSGKNVTGPHMHYEYLLRGNDASSHVNPLNHILKSTSGVQIKDGRVMVQAGWGLSHVALAAGLEVSEKTYEFIYSLNKGLRGANNWKELNARMGPGDILSVKAPKNDEKPETPPTTAQDELQAKFDALTRLKAEMEAQYKLDIENINSEREKAKLEYDAKMADLNAKLARYESSAGKWGTPQTVAQEIIKSLNEQDQVNINRASVGLRGQALLWISGIYGSIENKFLRILAFVFTGGAITGLLAILSGIDWQALLQQNPGNVVLVAISFLASTGVFNGVAYWLEQLGQDIKREADGII